MEPYRTLACEMMEAMDRCKKGPPHKEISATMRGEMAVLYLLENESISMTAGEISRTLEMTTSRIAAVLGSLEKKEMILRQTDPTDKRRVLVTLTQQGSSFYRRRRQEVLEQMTEMLCFLGEEDAEHFVRIMKRLKIFNPTCMNKNKPENRKEESNDEQ